LASPSPERSENWARSPNPLQSGTKCPIAASNLIDVIGWPAVDMQQERCYTAPIGLRYSPSRPRFCFAPSRRHSTGPLWRIGQALASRGPVAAHASTVQEPIGIEWE
jgi:hypothetical protein